MFDRIINDRQPHPRDDLATLLASTMLPNGEPMGAAGNLRLLPHRVHRGP